VLRSPYDREILRLAAPALGALAAEPLYVLVDTAIVGHLGTTQLAALAIAATVLSSAFTIFNFLTYGTTARVARLHGAGRDEDAAALGAQALWLAVAIGLALALLAAPLAEPVARVMGADGRILDQAVLYLRIAALGSPFFMLAAAGQGFLRGVGDLRTPLWILIAAHSVNVVLELLFVYGIDWGIAGSAWGTVIAQAGMGAAFVWVQARASGWEPPNLERIRSLLELEDVIPRAFTPDADVIERAHAVWPLFAAIMPPGAAVFALDGILIGASDTRYLMWSMLAAAAVYIPLALFALEEGWGIVGVWAGLAALFAVRLLTLGGRFAGQRWALTGAPA
jgi:Na+-driven multidrug efflux pump